MSDKEKKVVPLTEEQISQKEADLQQREDKLKAEMEAFETEKADFEERKTSLDQKEADLKELEETLMSVDSSSEVAEPEPGLEFSYEKEKFKFRDDAPKRIFFGNGKRLTQEEIVKDKEALASIIHGSLIQRLK